MAKTPETFVRIQQVKDAAAILLGIPHPNDSGTSYQDYCNGIGFPLIKRFVEQRVAEMFPISDTTQAIEDTKALEEDGALGSIHYKFSPDTGGPQLGDAWLSHSEIEISYADSGIRRLFKAEVSRSAAGSKLEKLCIQGAERFVDPIALSRRRTQESKDQGLKFS